VAIFATALVIGSPGIPRAQPPASLEKFLRDVIKLNDVDLKTIEDKQVVTRLLPDTEKGEIAVFGIVRVKATADAFERLAQDPKHFRAMAGMDQIGVFSDAPVIEDLAALKVPDEDIDALKKCKPGSCDVKLTDDGMRRIGAIDWSAKDARERAELLFKDMLVDEAASYRTGGLAALGTMVDKEQPKSRGDEFHRLLQHSPYLFKYVPDFHAYIESYPQGSFRGTSTMLYWTRDSFSPKPVLSICAGSVARIDDDVISACRLLSATHFFNAGLDVCIGVPAEHAPGLYLVDVYRVRIDPPTGLLAGPAMKKVQSGIEEGVKKTLEGYRSKLKG
jgi:hypothetical protein